MPLETPRTYASLTFEPDPPRTRGSRLAPALGIAAALAAVGVAGGLLMASFRDDGVAASPATEAPVSDGLDIVVEQRPDGASAPPEASTEAGILPPVGDPAPPSERLA